MEWNEAIAILPLVLGRFLLLRHLCPTASKSLCVAPNSRLWLRVILRDIEGLIGTETYRRRERPAVAMVAPTRLFLDVRGSCSATDNYCYVAYRRAERDLLQQVGEDSQEQAARNRSRSKDEIINISPYESLKSLEGERRVSVRVNLPSRVRVMVYRKQTKWSSDQSRLSPALIGRAVLARR
jgi:hypothetical protein